MSSESPIALKEWCQERSNEFARRFTEAPDQLAGLYHPEKAELFINGDKFTGRQEIGDCWRKVTSGGAKKLVLITRSAEKRGEAIVETGVLSFQQDGELVEGTYEATHEEGADSAWFITSDKVVLDS